MAKFTSVRVDDLEVFVNELHEQLCGIKADTVSEAEVFAQAQAQTQTQFQAIQQEKASKSDLLLFEERVSLRFTDIDLKMQHLQDAVQQSLKQLELKTQATIEDRATIEDDLRKAEQRHAHQTVNKQLIQLGGQVLGIEQGHTQLESAMQTVQGSTTNQLEELKTMAQQLSTQTLTSMGLLDDSLKDLQDDLSLKASLAELSQQDALLSKLRGNVESLGNELDQKATIEGMQSLSSSVGRELEQKMSSTQLEDALKVVRETMNTKTDGSQFVEFAKRVEKATQDIRTEIAEKVSMAQLDETMSGGRSELGHLSEAVSVLQRESSDYARLDGMKALQEELVGKFGGLEVQVQDKMLVAATDFQKKVDVVHKQLASSTQRFDEMIDVQKIELTQNFSRLDECTLAMQQSLKQLELKTQAAIEDRAPKASLLQLEVDQRHAHQAIDQQLLQLGGQVLGIEQCHTQLESALQMVQGSVGNFCTTNQFEELKNTAQQHSTQTLASMGLLDDSLKSLQDDLSLKASLAELSQHGALLSHLRENIESLGNELDQKATIERMQFVSNSLGRELEQRASSTQLEDALKVVRETINTKTDGSQFVELAQRVEKATQDIRTEIAEKVSMVQLDETMSGGRRELGHLSEAVSVLQRESSDYARLDGMKALQEDLVGKFSGLEVQVQDSMLKAATDLQQTVDVIQTQLASSVTTQRFDEMMDVQKIELTQKATIKQLEGEVLAITDAIHQKSSCAQVEHLAQQVSQKSNISEVDIIAQSLRHELTQKMSVGQFIRVTDEVMQTCRHDMSQMAIVLAQLDDNNQAARSELQKKVSPAQLDSSTQALRQELAQKVDVVVLEDRIKLLHCELAGRLKSTPGTVAQEGSLDQLEAGLKSLSQIMSAKLSEKATVAQLNEGLQALQRELMQKTGTDQIGEQLGMLHQRLARKASMAQVDKRLRAWSALLGQRYVATPITRLQIEDNEVLKDVTSDVANLNPPLQGMDWKPTLPKVKVARLVAEFDQETSNLGGLEEAALPGTQTSTVPSSSVLADPYERSTTNS